MNTVTNKTDSIRARLVRILAAEGFTYYPEMHRLLRKREGCGEADDVVVVDLGPDFVCIHHLRSNAEADTWSDILFGYEQPGDVLSYLKTITAADAPKGRRHLMVA